MAFVVNIGGLEMHLSLSASAMLPLLPAGEGHADEAGDPENEEDGVVFGDEDSAEVGIQEGGEGEKEEPEKDGGDGDAIEVDSSVSAFELRLSS